MTADFLITIICWRKNCLRAHCFYVSVSAMDYKVYCDGKKNLSNLFREPQSTLTDLHG